MEPSIRVGDMVVYVSGDIAVRDVVVYCVTPSHCVVHRVIGMFHVDTVNENTTMLVTKGDNADTADSPISIDKVKGRVVLTIPRELWIPVLVALIAYALYGFIKTPVVGSSYAVALSIGLLLVVSVYATAPRLITPTPVPAPVVSLAGVYVDYASCTVSVRYMGVLSLTSAVVTVNSTPAEVVSVSGGTLVMKPNPDMLRASFETGAPLEIRVDGEFNDVVWLSGRYEVLIGGLNPELSVSNSTLLVYNPNCFPVTVDVAVKYLVKDAWYWSNTTLVVEGDSYVVVEPPEHAEQTYAFVYWFNQGDRRWVGLLIKTR